jgi:hypothetical protein
MPTSAQNTTEPDDNSSQASWDRLFKRAGGALSKVARYYQEFTRDPIEFTRNRKLVKWMEAVFECDGIRIEYDFSRHSSDPPHRPSERRKVGGGISQKEISQFKADLLAYTYSGAVIRRECRRLHRLDVPSDPNHRRGGYEEMPPAKEPVNIHAYADALNHRRASYRRAIQAINEVGRNGGDPPMRHRGRRDRVPLSEQARAMYKILCSLPETEGRPVKDLVKELGVQFHAIDGNRIRKLAIELKPYGIKRRRASGYHIPMSRRVNSENK